MWKFWGLHGGLTRGVGVYYGRMAVEEPRSDPPAKRMKLASIAALLQPSTSASSRSSSSEGSGPSHDRVVVGCEIPSAAVLVLCAEAQGGGFKNRNFCGPGGGGGGGN